MKAILAGLVIATVLAVSGTAVVQTAGDSGPDGSWIPVIQIGGDSGPDGS